MRRRPLAVVLPVLVADLALSTQASAGPPASCFRAKTRCDLTYYEATQTFKQKVSQKRRPRLTVAALTAVGVSAGCGPTKHRSPGFARCTITIEGGGLPAPCRIEAEYDSLAPRSESGDVAHDRSSHQSTPRSKRCRTRASSVSAFRRSGFCSSVWARRL